jgi:hypothetical protein
MTLTVREPVDTQHKLGTILPRWTGKASKKDHDRINEVAAAFIARSPFVEVSSARANGAHGRAEDRWRGQK